MRVIHFLILIFCIFSFVSLSNIEDDRNFINARDKRPLKRIRIEIVPVDGRTCDICNSCEAGRWMLSYPHCGHCFHLHCLHNEFITTDPKESVKCRQCGTDIHYETFIIGLAAVQDPPCDIPFLRERLTAEALGNIIVSVIKNNGLDILRNMIKLKIPFNESPSFKNYSALVVAACYGTADALKILIESGLKFAPETDGNVNILLRNAVFHKKSGIAKYLISIGANVNRIFSQSKIALIHQEVKFGNVEAVKILIENNADVNIKSETMGYPLHIAVENGRDEIVELLLKAGASTEVKNHDLRTAFLSACYLNRASAARLLMEHGCKTDYFTVEGYNALHFAIYAGSLDVLKYLMTQNFSIHMKDGTPSYILHRATYGYKTEMVKYLLSIGANPYETFDNATFQLLVKSNPNFSDMISFSDPAIVIAILYNHYELVKAFLDAGVNPNTRIFNASSTLLHLAIQNGSAEIAKLLISSGADINAMDSAGFNPLNYAAPEWAQVLVAHSAQAL